MSDESKPAEERQPERLPSEDAFPRPGDEGPSVPADMAPPPTRLPASSDGLTNAILKRRQNSAEVGTANLTQHPMPNLVDAPADQKSPKMVAASGPTFAFRHLLDRSAEFNAKRQPDEETDALAAAMAKVKLGPNLLPTMEELDSIGINIIFNLLLAGKKILREAVASEEEAVAPEEEAVAPEEEAVAPEEEAVASEEEAVASKEPDNIVAAVVLRQSRELRFTTCRQLVEMVIAEIKSEFPARARSEKHIDKEWLEEERKYLADELHQAVTSAVEAKLQSSAQPPASEDDAGSDGGSLGGAQADRNRTTPNDLSDLVWDRIAHSRKNFLQPKDDMKDSPGGSDVDARIALVDKLIASKAPEVELRFRQKDADLLAGTDGDPSAQRAALRRLYVVGLEAVQGESGQVPEFRTTRDLPDDNIEARRGSSQLFHLMRRLQVALVKCDDEMKVGDDNQYYFLDLMLKLDLVRREYNLEPDD